jgi:hypothetical protein
MGSGDLTQRLEQLLSQRGQLRARVQELEGKVKALDMTDVSKAVSSAQKLNLELWSMEDVLANLEREIAKTHEALAVQEQARLKAVRAAMEGKDRLAIREVVEATLKLRDAIAGYGQTQLDMHKAGADTTEQLPERLGKAVNHVLGWWGRTWPELVGLAAPDLAAELAAERAARIDGAERELARLQRGDIRPDEAAFKDARVADIRASLAFMRRGAK